MYIMFKYLHLQAITKQILLFFLAYDFFTLMQKTNNSKSDKECKSDYGK